MQFRRTMVDVSIALICIFLVWEFLWPSYRQFVRTSNAHQAVRSAYIMRPIIDERLRKREGATAVNADLRIQAEYPVSGGYVTPDGTVVVNAQIDHFLPFTFILRPQLNSKNEVEWTCGVAKQEQFRHIRGYTECDHVLDLPDNR